MVNVKIGNIVVFRFLWVRIVSFLPTFDAVNGQMRKMFREGIHFKIKRLEVTRHRMLFASGRPQSSRVK